MRERQATATGGYDWSTFGRHRLRAPAGVLIDSPLGPAGSGWLGTLWPVEEAGGWTRMLWTPDTNLGGWTIPSRLAGGDVIEFGADRAGRVARWYGILDSYDAIEWVAVRGPYSDPLMAYGQAQQLLAGLRFDSLPRAGRSPVACTRKASRRA